MKRTAANEGKKSRGTSRSLTILIPGWQSADLLLHLAQSLDLRHSLACIAATVIPVTRVSKGWREAVFEINFALAETFITAVTAMATVAIFLSLQYSSDFHFPPRCLIQLAQLRSTHSTSKS